MKKVTIFGGGTGMSTLLKGLKEFPLDITSVVSVCDDGKSTGKLRKEFNIPAMGDIRRVMISLSETEPLMEKLLNYRFSSNSELNEHTVGNLLLTAGTQITGNLSDGIKSIGKVLNLKGKVIPFSEDNIVLSAIMEDGSIVNGEHYITESPLKIKKVYYEKEPEICDEVFDSIDESDLIILSMGSLYTSVLPNIICKEVEEVLNESKAPIMYTCNIVTQPGETDNFTVGDHVKLLNRYLDKKKVDVVIASNTKIDDEMAKRYESQEQKDPVLIDYDEIKKIGVELIEDDLITIDDNTLKHNSLKLSSLIFSYLMRK